MKEELRKFEQRLKGLRLTGNIPLVKEFLALSGLGYSIAFSKCIALNIQFLYARESLIRAFDTNPKNAYGEQAENPIWERTFFLQNATMTYNSCLDYVYAVLYFYYDVESKIKTIKNSDDVKKIDECIKGKEILDKIVNATLANKPILVNKLKQYKQNTRKLRENANNIKHHAGYWVDGNSIASIGKITVNNVDITDIITPKILDINEEVEELVKVHCDLFQLLKQLFDDLNFNGIIDRFLKANNLNKDI